MTQLTDEQQKIANYKGNCLVVSAFAGTGKTFTLVEYAKANPNDRILYMAFNKAICDEAKAKFPSNVEVRTSHSIAYSRFGGKLRHKLKPNLRLTDITNALGVRDWALATQIRDRLNEFMSSEDKDFEIDYNKSELMHTAEGQLLIQEEEAKLEQVRGFWKRMIDPNDSFPCVHDTYLKLYQLSEPELDKYYDTVLFDEAQDANPVTSHIVLSQRCKKILVGDTHQQIYRFRGADNALHHPLLEEADRLYLTNSFRFGPKVADLANMILEVKGETLEVKGLGGDDEVIHEVDNRLNSDLTVLHRTRSGTIATAVSYMQSGKSVYWIGGIDAYGLNDLIDLFHLREGRHEDIAQRQLLKDFPEYRFYLEAAEESGDPEMNSNIKILNDLDNVPLVARELRQNAVSNIRAADVIVSTAHRSKGLEWDTVVLYDDFPDLIDEGELAFDEKEIEDELNLLYVASTRAQQLLYVPKTIMANIRAVDLVKSRRGLEVTE